MDILIQQNHFVELIGLEITVIEAIATLTCLLRAAKQDTERDWLRKDLQKVRPELAQVNAEDDEEKQDDNILPEVPVTVYSSKLEEAKFELHDELAIYSR